MPKRSKKQAQIDEHEGRPPSLTLASFIQIPNLETSANSTIVKETVPDKVPEVETSVSVAQGNTYSSEETNVDELQPGISVSNVEQNYSIGKTKKGKLPISCENRSKGKKVTVISNVTGDAHALLHELKKRAGCGGVLREGTVELQGDRVLFVSKFLTGHPCVKPYRG